MSNAKSSAIKDYEFDMPTDSIFNVRALHIALGSKKYRDKLEQSSQYVQRAALMYSNSEEESKAFPSIFVHKQ